MLPTDPANDPALRPNFGSAPSGGGSSANGPPPPAARGPESPTPRTPPTLAILLTILLVLVAYSISQSIWNGSAGLGGGRADAEARVVTPRGDLAEDEKSTIELFQRMSQSVVSISTATLRPGPGFNAVEVPSGTGTGFVWDEQGHIVTNFHVLEGGERWRVTLADQSTWNAEVVGLAEDRDLAVLSIKAPPQRLRPVLIGTSRDLRVGQRVFAIGSPFGLDQTLTTGIISGLGREIPSRSNRLIQGVIQTDAAINPGNSGGPLLDSAGRLIGVNTAIYSPTGTSAGIGFAIPVDMVNRTIPQLLKYGRAVRPVLGVRIAPDAMLAQLNLTGVMVLAVQPGSAAESAGLQGIQLDRDTVTGLGDIIIKVDDREITRQDDLFAALEQSEFGQTIKLTIIRNAKTDQQSMIEVPIKL
ncbi:MAG: trypsin-like peptidase domain-containing protein [Pirellulales bacterium]